MNSFMALVKRELWEHRQLTYVPLAQAGVLILSALFLATQAISRGGMLEINITDMKIDNIGNALGLLNGGMAFMFMFVTGWVVVFYLMDCLKADRDDRSILFWKSLPISDTKTVFSKLTCATLVAPLIAVIVSFLCMIVLLVIASIVLSVTGITNASVLWTDNPLLSSTAFILYAIPVQALWFFPITCWLLLVSAYANRAVFLWAVLPPVLAIWVEKLIFDTQGIATFIAEHFHGIFPLVILGGDHFDNYFTNFEGNLDFTLTDFISPTVYLQSPELWEGLVVGALLLAAAIWVRRYRDESL